MDGRLFHRLFLVGWLGTALVRLPAASVGIGRAAPT
ncbi:hypothetical protein HNR42_000440 [Deinobacterium chartae]|uniref:Uncharacterized protein n=1 Tax=Deinobacterium chartae TaxID=521158 RepID=A0A841HVT4_9DEIO|nr:hypothetical protein [Deinobacterium chartae]